MLRRRLMMIRRKEEANKFIRFTIEGGRFYALPNMTWGEWVNSKYNTHGFTINESDNSIMINSWYRVGTENDYVYSSEVIQEDYNYLLIS